MLREILVARGAEGVTHQHTPQSRLLRKRRWGTVRRRLWFVVLNRLPIWLILHTPAYELCARQRVRRDLLARFCAAQFWVSGVFANGLHNQMLNIPTRALSCHKSRKSGIILRSYAANQEEKPRGRGAKSFFFITGRRGREGPRGRAIRVRSEGAACGACSMRSVVRRAPFGTR